MIDQVWLRSVLCLVGGDLGGEDLDQICHKLGVREEVLPFLVLTAGSLSDWPSTRQALRTAARSVTRPVQMRPNQDVQLTSDGERKELREALSAVLARRETIEDSSGDNYLRAVQAVARYRSSKNGAPSEPHSFIPVE
jgi:hypothetical protein